MEIYFIEEFELIQSILFTYFIYFLCYILYKIIFFLIKGPSTLATLFNHMWPRIVAGIFIPVGNHYFQALASTLQFVAQVCDRLWLVPATDRAFAYITYMSPPHFALVCSGPPQCAATCGWTKFPVCSGPKNVSLKRNESFEIYLWIFFLCCLGPAFYNKLDYPWPVGSN